MYDSPVSPEWYVRLCVHACLTVVYLFLLPTRGAATDMYLSNAKYTKSDLICVNTLTERQYNPLTHPQY
jgi:hypothetical protein